MLDQLADNYERLFLGGVFAVAGAAVFFRGFKKLSALRRVENTPTCTIRSIPMGTVELKGRAYMKEPIEAPFSARLVAYYEVEIEESHKRGKDSGWTLIHSGASQKPFELDDGTGRVRVIPDGAESRLSNASARRSSFFSELPARLQSYMSKVGFEGGLSGGLGLRFTERCIEIGETVYVHGVAHERRALDLWREQMEGVSEKLGVVKADPDEMERLDVDGDGRISDDEWQSAHSRAIADVQREGAENRVAIAQGNSGELFLISDRREKNLVSYLRLEAAVNALGGGTAFIGGVVMLLSTLF